MEYLTDALVTRKTLQYDTRGTNVSTKRGKGCLTYVCIKPGSCNYHASRATFVDTTMCSALLILRKSCCASHNIKSVTIAIDK